MLIQQDLSRAVKDIRRPWQDEPCSIGDFIQVSADSYHKDKEGIIVFVNGDQDDVTYNFRPMCRLSGQPPSFFNIDVAIDDPIASRYK